jgi:hypothetical protein
MLNGDGNLRISWQPIDDADAYAVLILDTDLLEVDRIETGSRRSASLSPETLDSYRGRDFGLLWCVIGVRDGLEVGRSAMHSIDPRLP